MVNVGVEQVFAILLKTFHLALCLTRHEFLTARCAQHISCGICKCEESYYYFYINTFYRAAFNKRTVLNALSKQMDTAAWLCNQSFLQYAVVELLLLVTRPLPRDGGMADGHGAPEAGQLPRVWTRGRTETESRQRVSGARESAAGQCRMR